MSAVLKPVPWFAPMSEADLDSVMQIEQAIYAFPWTHANFRDSLRAGSSCWTYGEGAGLIGYAVLLLAAGEAHLLNLSIAAPVQRRGHGRSLLDRLLDISRRQGARVMFLEVRPSNEAGKRLYEDFHFTQVGVRRGYYPAHDGREDAHVFALNL